MSPAHRTATAPPPTADQQAEHGELLGIGAAAAQAGVSERALRYYQQLGLLEPASTTPGGLRRYSADDLARVARIRELQTLLGLNLDEIAIVLRNEDRLAQIRRAYRDERTSDDERRSSAASAWPCWRACARRWRPSGSPWRASWPTSMPASAAARTCSPTVTAGRPKRQNVPLLRHQQPAVMVLVPEAAV